MEIALLEVQDRLISKADEELQGLFVEYGDIINAQMAIIYRERKYHIYEKINCA
ncbi:hypothetical protein [Clostridium kluyveri]|uniref:hypothetical protein n=1 Tax=Clostridium kluyveri TaxID=1534 RepID=UPI002247B0DA|nr:hypothetical protein [Clostridium kluyveri]UZQ48967.1 hypothetical protein OP486_13370 [Clostridium kluyveri]